MRCEGLNWDEMIEKHGDLNIEQAQALLKRFGCTKCNGREFNWQIIPDYSKNGRS